MVNRPCPLNLHHFDCQCTDSPGVADFQVTVTPSPRREDVWLVYLGEAGLGELLGKVQQQPHGWLLTPSKGQTIGPSTRASWWGLERSAEELARTAITFSVTVEGDTEEDQAPTETTCPACDGRGWHQTTPEDTEDCGRCEGYGAQVTQAPMFQAVGLLEYDTEEDPGGGGPQVH